MIISDTYRDVLGLRVVRRYRDLPVPEEDVDALLVAGRWTGSSKNRQGWAFIVIDDAAVRDRLVTAGDFTTPMQAAPLTIALVRTPEGNDFDIGRVAQNVMLAAAARGFGSCPITLHHQGRARDVLGLPDDHECRWAIAIGYPDAAGEVEHRASLRQIGMSGRKPLASLVHHNRWSR